MAQPVKLTDEVMALVRREADMHGRSVAGQITHWLKLGRAIEQSGTCDQARIIVALAGRFETTRLSEAEEFVWLDAFTDRMGQPSNADKDFYANRRALGLGVGLDAGGNLIFAKKNSPT